MRIFRCDHCGNALYFENVTCLRCGSDLAFLPGRMDLCAVEPVGEAAPGRWQRKAAGRQEAGQHWRMCQHREATQSCNFAVPAADPNPLCVSCRLTRVLPDLSEPRNRVRWYRIEVAKRRLWFTLARLRLMPCEPPAGQAVGPRFEFKQDLPGQPVLTGHDEGVITLNVAEADDDERVRRRVALHEPYRTLLGHLRHESGHFYWDPLISQASRHEDFRRLFGDERADYQRALGEHYARGGEVAAWQDRFVSAYATAHPWEDWAETWAHYLHMVDLLETAASYNTRMSVPGSRSDEKEEVDDPFQAQPMAFDALVQQWIPLTLLLNSLNRSLGQDDAYPFALSPGAMDKLRFVHETINYAAGGPRPLQPA